MNKIRILTVDDTRIVNEGMSSLLSMEEDLEVAGKVLSGEDCLRWLRINSADIVLLDHQMPAQNGLETLSAIREAKFPVRVILLTLLAGEHLIQQYFDAKVDGCVLKHDSPDELIFGIRAVAKGEAYYSTSVSKVLSGNFNQQKRWNTSSSEDIQRLTKAELQVLSMIGQGLSVEEISLCRSTSVKTINRQKQNIMDKLNIHKETKLMRFAIEHGI